MLFSIQNCMILTDHSHPLQVVVLDVHHLLSQLRNQIQMGGQIILIQLRIAIKIWTNNMDQIFGLLVIQHIKMYR